MNPRLIILMLGTAVLLLAAAPVSNQPTVLVTLKPVNIQQHYFDPGNPPQGLPALPEAEAACSVALFSCHCDVDLAVTAEKPSVMGTEITAEIKAIRVTLCLDDTLWLPNGSSAKLLAHEQGHAEISRKFFLKATDPVERASKLLIDQTITTEGTDHQSAIEAAAQKVNAKIGHVYSMQTTTASSPVQEAYDQLTDHSRNKIPEEKAIPLAMKHAPDIATTEPSY